MIALQVRDVVGVDFDLDQIRFQFRGHGQAPPLDELLDDEEFEEAELCDEDEEEEEEEEEEEDAEHHLW